jgi:hypothetical protein
VTVQTEMIRKTLGKPQDICVFERVRRLNAELDRLGIPRSKGDGLVKRVIGPPRQRTG